MDVVVADPGDDARLDASDLIVLELGDGVGLAEKKLEGGGRRHDEPTVPRRQRDVERVEVVRPVRRGLDLDQRVAVTDPAAHGLVVAVDDDDLGDADALPEWLLLERLVAGRADLDDQSSGALDTAG